MIMTQLESGRVMLHNEDFSGDLHINVYPGELKTIEAAPGEPETARVVIPFEDIKEIVAGYIRGALTVQIEAADTDWLLLGPDVSSCRS